MQYLCLAYILTILSTRQKSYTPETSVVVVFLVVVAGFNTWSTLFVIFVRNITS